MTNLPKITVITPVYNCEAYLARAIESVHAQQYPNLEYWVLDANSTDGTIGIIQHYAEKGVITHWRSHADNGPAAAYNEGITNATGDIIVLLNADDWLEPETLQKAGELCARDPALEVVTVLPKSVRLSAEGALETASTFDRARLPVGFRSHIVPNIRFYRKALFETIGLFEATDDRGHHMIMTDLDFLIRLALYQPKQTVLEHVGYTYFAHAGSITQGGNKEHKKIMHYQRVYIMRKHCEHLATYPQIAQGLIKRWHRRGSTRLFFWQWHDGKKEEAWHTLKEGIQISGVIWLLDVLRVGMLRKYV